jgi:hypothetical protein
MFKTKGKGRMTLHLIQTPCIKIHSLTWLMLAAPTLIAAMYSDTLDTSARDPDTQPSLEQGPCNLKFFLKSAIDRGNELPTAQHFPAKPNRCNASIIHTVP